jgi:two-component system response regulator RegA
MLNDGSGMNLAEVQHVRSVLIVDDEESQRRRLAADFSRKGCSARTAATLEEAVALAREQPVDLAVVDLQLADRSGLDVLEILRAESLAARIVVLSGYASVPVTVAAMRLGAFDVVTKPASAAALLDALEPAALRERPTHAELPSLGRTEWEHIQRALHDAGGSISEAARRLGIPRRTLQRKLRKAPPQQ